MSYLMMSAWASLLNFHNMVSSVVPLQSRHKFILRTGGTKMRESLCHLESIRTAIIFVCVSLLNIGCILSL